MTINKPIAGNIIRNLSLDDSMTCTVIIATADGAALMDWDSKLDFKPWDCLAIDNGQYEISRDGGQTWIPMFPELFK